MIGQALRSGHWPSLVGAWMHFEVSFMVWLLIGALGVPIAEELGLTATQKGFLVALPLLGGALLRVGVGVASDRFGAKPVGLALLGGELLALVWGWMGATSYTELLGLGLFLGVAGASFAVALPLASQAYPPAYQGLAMGVAASANSGTVLAAFFAPRLAHIVGWHGVFGVMALPVLLTAVLFAALVQSGGGATRYERGTGWSRALANMLRRRSAYWLCFLYAVTFGGFVGLCSFLPIFFHDQYGVEQVMAGSLAALCGLGGSLIRPFGGYLADRLHALRVLQVLFGAIAVGAAALAQLPRLAWVAGLMMGTMAAMGCGNGVIFRVVSDRFAKQMGMASGLIGAAGGLGGFLLPSWLGLLKDATGGYRSGFLLLAAVSVVAALSVALAIRRSRRSASSLTELESVLH